MMTFLQEVAAAVITPRFRALSAGEIFEKNPGDLVTAADREAEVIITDRLREAYPDAVILGEETSHHQPELFEAYTRADHAFTVDPVDGTKNFVNGSPDHAVMVSEVRDGQTVRAWIWQPEHRAAWIAELGAGTTRNGEIVRRQPLSPEVPLRGVTSMRDLVGRRPPGLEPLELTWISCGIDYPKLIEGEADFIIYKAAKAWDHVPGSLLLTEAGGAVGQADGTPYGPFALVPSFVPAGDPGILERVLPAVADLLD